ncbi:MAG: type II secretion system protein [Pedosphaera sp.]|nr:type II secretion system protein [Pedosphaera sp.]
MTMNLRDFHAVLTWSSDFSRSGRYECGTPNSLPRTSEGLPHPRQRRGAVRTPRTTHVPGFTLIELMVVVGILSIVLAMGIPSIARALKKEGLRKGESDLMEACSHARAQSILSGLPMELAIRAQGGQISVEPLKNMDGHNSSTAGEFSEVTPPRPPPKSFSATLDDDIAIRVLAVNFKDQMEFPEVRVRFFPNGTSDEFTIMFFSAQGERKVSLDVVTGLANSQIIR